MLRAGYQILSGDKITYVEMEGHVALWRWKEMYARLWYGKPKWIDHVKDLSRNWRVRFLGKCHVH